MKNKNKYLLFIDGEIEMVSSHLKRVINTIEGEAGMHHWGKKEAKARCKVYKATNIQRIKLKIA